jgi:hypothetical protein
MSTRALVQAKPSATSASPVRTSLLQRKCACGGTAGPNGECEECRKKRQQQEIGNPKSETRNDSSVPPIVHEVLSSPGKPLDPKTRAFMEPRFGHDFSRVRVHTDEVAAKAALAVNARAYTVGQHVVFAAGQYAPNTSGGSQLMAHELAHTIQQEGLVHRTPQPLEQTDVQDNQEREAVETADNITRGVAFDVTNYSIPRLARETARSATPAASACPSGVKTVTVDLVSLAGSTRNPPDDLTFANGVFKTCCVQFALRKGLSVAPSLSNTWLGGDTTLNRGTSPGVVREEAPTYDGATSAFGLSSRIRAFYVEAIDPPARATSRPPVWATGPAAPYADMVIVTNGAASRSLAHEFGHLLLNVSGAVHTAHPGGTDNLMEPTDSATGETLEPTQCTTIFANA